MRIGLFAATASLALLAACNQNNPATPRESANTAAPTADFQARINLAPVDKAKAAAVKAGAAKIADLSVKASNWFQAGTGPDVGKTGAKPANWQHPDDFNAKLTAFQRAAKNFAAVSTGGDAAAAKAAYGDLGKTCKACHDTYRSEMHH